MNVVTSMSIDCRNIAGGNELFGAVGRRQYSEKIKVLSMSGVEGNIL